MRFGLHFSSPVNHPFALSLFSGPLTTQLPTPESQEPSGRRDRPQRPPRPGPVPPSVRLSSKPQAVWSSSQLTSGAPATVGSGLNNPLPIVPFSLLRAHRHAAVSAQKKLRGRQGSHIHQQTRPQPRHDQRVAVVCFPNLGTARWYLGSTGQNISAPILGLDLNYAEYYKCLRARIPKSSRSSIS
ncbi:hypothetical protein NDU88_005625 [Pleurodeles waltl]|uniref:Uncharacterized protein n=1 Tax=Pleurodeles waltl TaxID=8319 RepID=A0AAV7MHG7_PLEWA|nr:hypothetical protein NDU88_005625 [Pleurodeles waltl]